MKGVREEETAREQRCVDRLHRRLDELREEVGLRLAAVLREAGGGAQARVERGVAVELCGRLLAGYEAAEEGLCFGRLDLCDGGSLHIGRVGQQVVDAETSLRFTPAPAARRREREASAARCRSCHNGPSSATRSAITSGDARCAA
ncbi:hypothetical protein GCM10027168_70650 [Streptomyces capparidis]